MKLFRSRNGVTVALSCSLLLLVLLSCSPTFISAQMDGDDYGDYPEYNDYANDYQQDNLYHDYAERAQEKQVGGPGGAGFGMGKALLLSIATWAMGGKYHARGATKQLKTQFQKEQKALYTQYYNDVYKLTESNNQLQSKIDRLEKALKDTKDKAELEAIQRDYDEFKQPDIDGDDRISRAEFNMYVKNYLSNYPGLSEKDYPKFEDFDHDGDGYVGFQEYAQQMALQVQKAELEQHYADNKSGGGATAAAKKKKTQGLQGLQKESTNADTFQDLYGQYLK